MTARELIVGALRLLGVKGSGDTLDSTEDSELIVALNDMLEAWTVEGLLVPTRALETFTYPSATTSRAIGPAGDFVTPRPIKIEAAFIRDGSNDYPLEVISAFEYSQITNKTIQSTIPEYLFYNPTMTSGTIYLWPVPSQSVTLGLTSLKPLGPVAIGDTLSFNPGYSKALRFNLAIELAPEYGKSASPEIVAVAEDMKERLKVQNLVVPKLAFDTPTDLDWFDINTGGSR